MSLLWVLLVYEKFSLGNSLVVQWLGLCTFTAEGVGSVPGWGTKIPQAVRRGQKEKKKKFRLMFVDGSKQSGVKMRLLSVLQLKSETNWGDSGPQLCYRVALLNVRVAASMCRSPGVGTWWQTWWQWPLPGRAGCLLCADGLLVQLEAQARVPPAHWLPWEPIGWGQPSRTRNSSRDLQNRGADPSLPLHRFFLPSGPWPQALLPFGSN